MRFRTLSRLLPVALLALSTGAAAAVPGDDAAFRIVTTDWVAEHAADPSVLILDVRTSVAAYQAGHVPGAVFLANDTLRAPSRGVPVQYLEPDAMAGLFRRAGVDPDDTVVVYAAGKEVLGATMVAYGLQRIGHADVAILDAGIDAYRLAHPLSQAYPAVDDGAVSGALDRSIFVDLATLVSLVERGDVVILDTRPAAAYLGNTTRWIRNGHIPGAVNLDWRLLMEPGNLHDFKSVDAIRELLAATGVRPQDDVIVYCGTSREATLVHQVMRHVLGFPRVRLYEGSWTEYCARPELPIERDGRVVSPASLATHALPVTDRLEPYACGTVKRIHTWSGIFLASQPSPEDFELAAASGVRTVINQRLERETTAFDERAVVTGLGMKYVSLPWNGPEELTDEVLDLTRAQLATAAQPVLLHCGSANRVGATWLAFSVLDRGLTWDAALAEAKIVGLRTPAYEDVVRAYVEQRQTRSELESRTREAILTALADERAAIAYYTAVIERFGPRRPFIHVIDAERQHAQSLAALLDRYDVTVPLDRSTVNAQDVPADFVAACRKAIALEQENVRMYDRLLEQVELQDVRQVMKQLQTVSRDRHLPAFQRSID